MSCILSKNDVVMFYIKKKRVSKKEFYKKYPNFSEKNCKLSKEKQKLEEDMKSLNSIKNDIVRKESPLTSYRQKLEDYKKLLIEKEKNLIEYTDRFIKEQNINLENLKKIKDCEKQKENMNILKTDIENLRLKYEKSILIQNEYSDQIKKLEDEHESLSQKHSEIIAKLNISEENYKKELAEFKELQKLQKSKKEEYKECKESKECDQIKSDLITCKSVNEKYSKDLEKLKREYDELLYSKQIIEDKLEKEVSLSKSLNSSLEENKKLLGETYNEIQTIRQELSLSKSKEKEIKENLEKTLERENKEIYNNKVKQNLILEQEERIKMLLDEIKEKTDRLQMDIITKQDLEENIKILQDKIINLSMEDELFKKRVKEEKDKFIENQDILDKNIEEAKKLIDDLIYENRLKTLEIEKLIKEIKDKKKEDSSDEEISEKKHDSSDEEISEKKEDSSDEEINEKKQYNTLFDYLKDLQKNDPNKKQKAVLITTGSFNPVHKTHIRMASLAANKCNKDAKFISQEGPVVAVVFSPSSDIYLKGKMKSAGKEKDAINQDQRFEMLNLAIKDYDKESDSNVRFFSDDWEMKNGNPDFDKVTQSLDKRIIEEKIPNIKVLYLCGADHLTKYIGPSYLLKGNYKAVGVNRYDDGKPLITYNRRKEYEKANNHYIVDFDLIDSIQYENYDPSASSTKVRKAAYDFDKKTLSDLLFPSTLTYLITHNIFNLGNEKDVKYFLKKEEEKDWIEIDYLNQPTVIDALKKYIEDRYKYDEELQDGIKISIPHTQGGTFKGFFYKDDENSYHYLTENGKRRDIKISNTKPVIQSLSQPILKSFVEKTNLNWFENIYGFKEKEKDTYSVYDYDEKTETLKNKLNPNYEFNIGKTSSPSIKDLKLQLQSLNILNKDKFIDKNQIGYYVILDNVINLHHDFKNNGAVFQAASQFNLLEMPSQNVSPDEGITGYIRDKTQGPACAMSCPGALLYRNYFMKHDGSNIKEEGKFIGQLDGHQINMLGDIEDYNKDKNYWHFKNGYILPHKDNIEGMSNFGKILKNSEMFNFYKDMLRVGVQWNTQVWNTNIKVCQIYCSGIPISYMSDNFIEILKKDDTKKGNFIYFCKFILYCAMEATILTSIILSQKRKERIKVYLTNVGCGAFGNKDEWLRNILIDVLRKYKEYPLDVYMVIYEKHDKKEMLLENYNIYDEIMK